MTTGRRRRGRPATEPAAPTPEPSAAEPAANVPPEAETPIGPVDLIADEMTLAQAQLDAGLPALAEGTLLGRMAYLEADGTRVDDELDALRGLLAVALWRQGRPIAARRALGAMRPGSAQRHLPIVMMIEAEGLAAAGELDRAAGAMERVIASIGVDAAHALRGGVPGRLSWPLPSDLRPPAPPPARPPWSADPEDGAASATPASEVGRPAAARARLEGARVAYVAGDLHRGDADMSLALRLDTALAADGVAIIEPTLGGQPGAERLLLYGDLLRAAGRRTEAEGAYDRAADRRR